MAQLLQAFALELQEAKPIQGCKWRCVLISGGCLGHHRPLRVKVGGEGGKRAVRSGSRIADPICGCSHSSCVSVIARRPVLFVLNRLKGMTESP